MISKKNFYFESSIQAAFFSGDGDSGFPLNYNGGINFNYDHKKTKRQRKGFVSSRLKESKTNHHRQFSSW